MFDSIRAMMREPLLHFLVGGAGLFLLFSFVDESNRIANDEIVVSVGRVNNIVTTFEKARRRQPTDTELRGLIDDFIVEEVLYREAVAIGLDRDDTIIRRRLRQKMEFLLDDFTVVEATDADLQLFLQNNVEQYRTDAVISFEQVYLNEFSADKAAALLSKLRSGEIENPQDLSESHLLPYRFLDAPETVVSAQFGADFSAMLFKLDAGPWTGPVESPFGIHLIRIENIASGRIPALGEIRRVLERDWLADYRAAAQQEILEKMQGEYTITIEMPDDSEQ